MDSFSNTLNRFKILNFATIREPSAPDPLQGARDSLSWPGVPPPEPKFSLHHCHMMARREDNGRRNYHYDIENTYLQTIASEKKDG